MKKALLTIGNTFRGDDGVGYAIGEAVRDKSGWEVFHGEDCPENQINLIRKFAPDIVLIVDAVLGLDVGDVQFLDVEEDEIQTFSTHTIPVQYLIQFLKDFCGSVVFLGVGVDGGMIKNIEPGLSDSAKNAAVKAEEMICRFDQILVP